MWKNPQRKQNKAAFQSETGKRRNLILKEIKL